MYHDLFDHSSPFIFTFFAILLLIDIYFPFFNSFHSAIYQVNNFVQTSIKICKPFSQRVSYNILFELPNWLLSYLPWVLCLECSATKSEPCHIEHVMLDKSCQSI